MNINAYIINTLLSGTLFVSCFSSAYANTVPLQLPPEKPIKDTVDKPEEVLTASLLAIRIREAVDEILEEIVIQIELEQDIIAIIAEELKTNGPSNDTLAEAAVNSPLNEELKDNLDSIISHTTVGINQKVSEYRKNIAPQEDDVTQVSKSKTSTQTAAKSVEKTEKKVSKQKVASNAPKFSSKKGWVYIGQFINSSWAEKMLKIENELPKKGKNYLLNFSVNIRDSLPSKRLGMSNVVNSLTIGDKIRVLNVHPSGNKGHYWALVEWLKRH